MGHGGRDDRAGRRDWLPTGVTRTDAADAAVRAVHVRQDGWVQRLMVRDPFADEDAPALQDVLDALDDPACRDIVSVLEEPMTADEISEASGVPLSTTYRKLDQLTEASLLEEGLEIRSDGQHASQYAISFEEVVIALSEQQEFTVEVSRRPRTADERLANIWSEVRKET